ncbi:hypothetical protein BN168_400120 [Clostridioides difficile CD002]|nr:hypothetical protein BN167_1000122 [Clostridioides difficile E13]CCL06580.1 hypothetical protein BN168_400120 [Clostridioides difficile CD002]
MNQTLVAKANNTNKTIDINTPGKITALFKSSLPSGTGSPFGRICNTTAINLEGIEYGNIYHISVVEKTATPTIVKNIFVRTVTKIPNFEAKNIQRGICHINSKIINIVAIIF